MTKVAAYRTLSVLTSAIALGITLIALFTICAIVQFIAPHLQVTHALVGLFTRSLVTSPQAWMEGIFFSLLLSQEFGFRVSSVGSKPRARMRP